MSDLPQIGPDLKFNHKLSDSDSRSYVLKGTVCVCVCVCALSCVQLFAALQTDCSCWATLSMGFSRQEY